MYLCSAGSGGPAGRTGLSPFPRYRGVELHEGEELRYAPLSKKFLTADLSLMRDFNKALIISLIHRHGTISRAEIAKRTNLSRCTVSTIANELLAANLVQESGTGQSQGGRRPILLEFNY